MSQKKSNLLLWIIVGAGAFFFLILCLAVLIVFFAGRSSSPIALSSGQLALLELTGTITDSKDFIDQLTEYGNRPGIKAVVLRINSPGGGVAATQEIYEAIKSFREETGKKVIVSMASVAASGGYYVACGADKIFANPGTVTGGIGVIAQWYNYADLLRWAKMQNVVIKSGDLKDAGSGTRLMTEEEKKYFQSLIDTMHGQFVAAVAGSRELDENIVRELADGRVYTGQEAKAHQLIDELGTLQDAIDAAAEIAGIQGKPRIISPQRRRVSLLDIILSDSESLLS
ncbi:MAG TPA: signal peptide peptidase SppA, partial [Acidobacteriota bacterium]|nr:signal peptide peptidase SppA [Acidobacteriota bacterium]